MNGNRGFNLTIDRKVGGGTPPREKGNAIVAEQIGPKTSGFIPSGAGVCNFGRSQ
jgi:hypothetical protein